ncbi:hypothetical protein [Hymenobacter nivis]|uniref:Uncharacterized protein n=1 Tax=Hymenobacter nivis TaxID=1850093 RepID=A0A2Z3GND0_9BACT|nr:hypothetical protein [Hymenobacter nivis]AWM33891.1 hypothetical protein DDQ68_14480 [Hymenobacter nivis]
MPTHHDNRKDRDNSDEHNLEGKPKAGVLPVDDFSEAKEEQLEKDALDAGVTHPNRGHDKPSIDKPAYD